MRAVPSITVAVIIALHSVLGCCWHHAHDSKFDAAAEITTTAVPKHVGCRHHKHEASPSACTPEQDESEHPDHQPCDEKCDLVGKGRIEQDETTREVFLDSTAIAEPVLIPATLRLPVGRIACTVTPPHVRRHLLLRLLLI